MTRFPAMRKAMMALASLACLTAAWAEGAPSAPYSDAMITSVAKFGTGLGFVTNTKMAWKNVSVFSDHKTWVYVDAANGQVTAVLYGRRPACHTTLSSDEMDKHAQSWLSDHGIQLDGWALRNRSVYQHADRKEYVYSWEKCSPEGVRLPCGLAIALGDDGTVRYLWHVERELEIPVIPKLSIMEAGGKASVAMEVSQNELSDRGLSVWFDTRGNQQLIWEFGSGSKGVGHTVGINAITGEISYTRAPLLADRAQHRTAQAR